MKKQKDSTSSKKPSSIISQDILTFLQSRNGRASKAEIARQFSIKGNDRIGLKQVLKDMLARGVLHHGTYRSYVLPETKETKEPSSLRRQGSSSVSQPSGRGQDSRMRGNDEKNRNRIDSDEQEDPTYFVGIFEPLKNGGGMVNPVSRQDKNPIMVGEDKTGEARRDDLVRAVYSQRGWSIEKVLADRDDVGFVSLMAIETLNIPHVFPQDVLDETNGIKVPPVGKRTDLRETPLVTIDGEDARDFDDAVHAVSDGNGGWHITVAIADVSHYVTPGSALDIEAYKRGNSVYFPDRVVPMLPEALSNDLCSLRPDENRACMAAIMHINDKGNLIGTQIVRGLMKSVARLTYTEVQMALDGQPDAKTKPILNTLLKPLYGAYQTLVKARQERGTVELDLPERKVIIENGQLKDIVSRARFDSHKLIEEMMILANVAVAKALEKQRQPAMYRIHAKPDAARWSSTREFLQELGLKTKPGLHPQPQDLQALLDQVAGRDEAPLVNDMVLRSMSQAAYSPDNIGHFGLALESYGHFTSPIRRYADLIVHRALIRAFKLGDDGLTDEEMRQLEKIGEHISIRERVAQTAERETIDRYIALYMVDKIGATFSARISGVTRFGIFVNIDPMGADGLVPIRTLPDDYYIHDEKRHSLVGRRSGLTFRLAMPLTVRLLEVEAATGRLLMELVTEGMKLPDRSRERRLDRRPRRDDEKGHSRRSENRDPDRRKNSRPPGKRR